MTEDQPEASPCEGNLAAEPELRYTTSGKQVVEFTVLVNERRHNTVTGDWEDGEPTRHRVKAFRQMGENVADSLGKGDRVIVHGTVSTHTWTAAIRRGLHGVHSSSWAESADLHMPAPDQFQCKGVHVPTH